MNYRTKPAREVGYDEGVADAREGKTPMTERQLAFYTDEYATGYLDGYNTEAQAVSDA